MLKLIILKQQDFPFKVLWSEGYDIMSQITYIMIDYFIYSCSMDLYDSIEQYNVLCNYTPLGLQFTMTV